MARNSHYNGLLKFELKHVLSDSMRGLVPVHIGHLAVHQNQVVRAPFEVIVLHILLYLVKRLLAVRSVVNYLIAVTEFN